MSDVVADARERYRSRVARLAAEKVDPEKLALVLAFLRGDISRAELCAVIDPKDRNNFRWWIGQTLTNAALCGCITIKVTPPPSRLRQAIEAVIDPRLNPPAPEPDRREFFTLGHKPPTIPKGTE